MPDDVEKRLNQILAKTRRHEARISDLEEDLALAQKEGRLREAAAIKKGIAAQLNEVQALEAETILIEEKLDDEQLEEDEAALILDSKARLDEVNHWRSEAVRTGDPTVAAVATRKLMEYAGRRGLASSGITSPDEIRAALEAEAAAELTRRKSKGFQEAMEAKRGAGGMYGL